ncbi:restriction endonuclease subunit S [Membranicola marinus]|uniref:Restriction endonuclease subunit S n=1 Tax=Membranihabitans marinus TaxID=1227546 RepID=A0A953HX10_9BACT|nr:restriction endonuclease subunit S [Membranihabitans marinus]MBY5959785.1 restriction endonuclease subunit S [Membranihabitans marinus]
MKMVEWSKVLTIKNGKSQKKVIDANGKYPIFGSGGKMGMANEFLCESGTTIIGRKGTINSPIFVDEKLWNVDTAFGIQANTDFLNKKYLFYFCLDYNFLKHDRSTTLPSLTKGDLLKIKIPLPPLPVQKRIAAILDQADELRQKDKQLIDHYDQLSQSLFLDMFGDPVTNPKGWEVEELGEIAQVIMGQSPKGTTYNENGIGTPLLNGPTEFGPKYPTETQWTTAPKKVSKKGDILFCVRGATAGKMNWANKEYCIGRGIASIRKNSDISLKYIFNILKMRYKIFQAESNGSTFINISKSDLSSIEIPLTSSRIQNEFADRVRAIEQQKQQAEEAARYSEELFQSLLQRAFKGELVKEDQIT